MLRSVLKRAQALVMMGEVSAGRQALEGAAFAPGNMTTLNQLRPRDQVGRTSIRSERQVSTSWDCSGPVRHDQRPFANPLVLPVERTTSCEW